MKSVQSPVLTLDVAHPPRPPGEVEEELLQAWSQVRNSASFRILKVIHGYGKSGKGGATKEVARNWLFRNRSRFKRIVDGENYGVFEAATQELRKHVGEYADADIGAINPGITIVWVK